MARSLILIFVLLLQVACGQQKQSLKDMEENTNHLINESSPYLLQHAHNPVNWYPWGEEALERASRENKILIISIGYAACHWCHVMEHESFEDSTVAKRMNEHFICVKVDREERPDIDQIYMTAAQLITGSGGWPLNAFALPDGKPFYAGTYFPKKNWVSLLNQIIELKQEQPEKLTEQANAVTNGIRQTEFISISEADHVFSMETAEIAWNRWEKSIDFEKGGQSRAPKFPMPVDWEYLLAYHYHSNNEKAIAAVLSTLDNMARGGIYDHVGGGFARYSTDADWHIPHFEKMLYDNAQLVSLYSYAYQLTKDPVYKKVVTETLEFIRRELMSEDGGFYSSLDADSEGEEGRFYVWTYEEIKDLLGEDSELFCDYYDINKAGNWEHKKNVLRIKSPGDQILRKFDLSEQEVDEKLAKARSTLLMAREKRVRPGLDDKILTSWNALMLKAWVDAYRVFQHQEYLKIALKNAEFIKEHMLNPEYRLWRNHKNGNSSINAFLDDYALTIQAFVSLYQATFDEKWLHEANELLDYTLEHFYDHETGMFNYTSGQDPELIARKMELSDNVIPASNSVMADNLFTLGKYFNNKEYSKLAEKMLSYMIDDFQKNPAYYANWGSLMLKLVNPFYEVAIVGDDALKRSAELSLYYLPNMILLGGKNEGELPLLQHKLVKDKTLIYVCIDKVCQLPVEQTGESVKQISKSY